MPGDEQVYLSLDPDSINFQSDSKRKSPRNHDPEKRKKEAPADRSSKSLAAPTGRHSKSTCSLQTLFLWSSFSLALALRHSSSSRPDSPRKASRRGGARGGGIQDYLVWREVCPHVRLGRQDSLGGREARPGARWTHAEGESLSEARRQVRSRRAGLARRERGS